MLTDFEKLFHWWHFILSSAVNWKCNNYHILYASWNTVSHRTYLKLCKTSLIQSLLHFTR